MTAEIPRTSKASTPDRSNPLAAALLLLALVVISYGPAIQNGYIWDDDDYVVENETLPDPDGLARIWFEYGAIPQYYPLVHTTYWLEYRLWAFEPGGYHAVNILLHAATALLLWRLLIFLGLPGAFAAAAIFALHPVQVESVAWITERKNVLSSALYLGAMLTYLRFVAAREGAAARRGALLYSASLALFAAALLSKTVTCSLPAALLLVQWWRNGRLTKRDLVPLLPFFALGLSLAGVTVWIEKHHVGAEGAEWDLSLAERTLILGRALWFYLTKLAWPSPLIFIYPRWVIDAGSMLQWFYPAGALALVAALWFARARIGRGPLVVALLFAGTLLPALGLFDVYPMRFSFVADHFQYLASMAPIVLFAVGWAKLAARVPRILAVIALAALLAVLGSLVWKQLPNYANEETLWLKTLEANPDAWIAHYNLGNQRFEENRWSEAIRWYRSALSANEDLARAHNNLAVLLGTTGDREGGIRHFRRAVEIDDLYTHAHFNLAMALRSEGRDAEAIPHYRKVIEQDPRHGAGHRALGLALYSTGQRDESRRYLDRANELDAQSAGAPPGPEGP
ncbi:MAG: tetratricopeptide repeat protein [bacterium]|nr:tetratricopeptide repeat protein [bacterium]